MEYNINDLLQPEDYMKGYRESVEKLKNNPNLVLFDRLCYEVFSTDMGKRLIEYIKETYVYPSLASRDSANYQISVIWSDGFKDAFRMIINAIKQHDQRIKAGMNQGRYE